MEAPVSTTVIAVSLPASGTPVGANVRTNFERLVVAIIRELGFTLKDPDGLGLTIVLAPDMTIAKALRLLASVIAVFEERCPPIRVKSLLHYGLVFRQENAGVVSYLGSAIRSANTLLARVTAMGGAFATKDFQDYALKVGSLPITMAAQPEAGSANPLLVVRFLERASPAAKTGRLLLSSDDAFLQFLKKRLASDLGPFAGPLVDNTNRSVTSAQELTHAVSHEVDDPKARQAFEVEVLAAVDARHAHTVAGDR